MRCGRAGQGARGDRCHRAASCGAGTLRGTTKPTSNGLAKGIVAGDSESSEAMQDLIETVTVFRDPSRIGGIEVEIAGRHTALLGENAFPNGVKGVWGKVVEGRELQSNILRAPAKPAGGSTSTRCASTPHRRHHRSWSEFLHPPASRGARIISASPESVATHAVS
ncbi:hypothetical protein MES5069_740008 [Mesorhizobium escarrei]|uniref:Uncharacterized protein n=1 Tax=Mesorhizobium escarrei TaxID=666018 RepID=A0ABM9EHM2_9HYPH|nr:hypothetical protein MES5069_740008 [Mesorhizobium escarrei]